MTFLVTTQKYGVIENYFKGMYTAFYYFAFPVTSANTERSFSTLKIL